LERPCASAGSFRIQADPVFCGDAFNITLDLAGVFQHFLQNQKALSG
jgi:hypothetical protein